MERTKGQKSRSKAQPDNTQGQKRKRNAVNSLKPQKSRKAKRTTYHSSSEDEDDEDLSTLQQTDEFVDDDASKASDNDGVKLPNLESILASKPKRAVAVAKDAPEEDSDAEDEEVDDEGEADDGSASDDSDAAQSTSAKPTRNRNDPSKLATSISSILGAKLTTSQRADPILARSAVASQTSKEVSESRLEAKARRKLRDEKRTAKERGRVKDVLGLNDERVSTAEVAELEKKLRKIAQRGVVKLFNAVRAAQVKGEEAAREVSGLVADGSQTAVLGTDKRKERVNEMSKKGFLDLLAGGGA